MKSILKEYIVKVLLQEKKYSGMRLETLTRKLAKRFIQEIKSPDVYQMMKNMEDVEIVITPDEIQLHDEKIDLFQLNILFDDSIEDNMTIESRGEYDSTGELTTITMDLFFPRKFNVKDIEDIYPELIENFRHELEHVYQDSREESSPDNLRTFKDFRDYYLSKSEIEAFTSGLKANAKSRKIPVSQVVSDKINNIIDDAKNAGIKDINVATLKNDLETSYFSYLKKRYPQAK
jgi:hypothetical protein